MKADRIITFLTATVLISGCASSNSGDVYSRNQVRSAQTVQMGTVQSIRHVQIEGTKSGVGAIGGGVAGGILGSTIGGGRGSTLAALGGAAIGAVGGSMAEEKLTKTAGLEITVKLDSGTTIAVVQEAGIIFSVGDRVRVLTGSNGITRVTR
jgi:outer membrane lipoprotein SlyB